MKALVLLAFGFLASASVSLTASAAQAVTCHQGYEYKMIRNSNGKVGFVPTGRRCVSKRWF